MDQLCLCLFVATAALLLHTGACTDKTVTCGAHVHRLNCDSGVISVDTAFYGRADTDTCAGGKSPEEVANTACSHADALQELQSRCNGKKWCELNANVFLEDPCSGTFKYLETSYSCVPAIHRVVCEHSMAYLQCDAGKTIKVLGADFGRRDHVTCAFRREPALVQKIDCSKPVPIVAQMCDGKNRCKVRAAEMVVEESCANTSLYLEYAYTCN
ncbi:L-rhamnose-binding lectin SML-like [Boleophthalmus pectinirostris]|uniref:L-rhamnose-binding lectin SML-like n=1 Tax=Boleophthalmus pectinirostris TaxID=150288 RepID=UPI00242DED8D|nr:L-rhamnose-binding lectin SML-like [Boleophthalmus pectinirostris]